MPMYESTKARAKTVQMITAKHYEKGNQAKSYKAVWRHYIAPIMGICYPTFLAYLKIKTD